MVDVSLAGESGEGVVAAAIFLAGAEEGEQEVADDAGSIGAVSAVEGDWGFIGHSDFIEDGLINIGETGETGAFGSGWNGTLDHGDFPIIAGSWGFAVEAIDVIRVSHVDIDFDAEFFDEGFAFRGDVFGIGGVGLVEFAAAIVETLFDVAVFD